MVTLQFLASTIDTYHNQNHISSPLEPIFHNPLSAPHNPINHPASPPSPRPHPSSHPKPTPKPLKMFRSSLRPFTSTLQTLAKPPPSRGLARLTLVGRLGTEPEVTTTNSGLQLIKYVVGTSYGPKDNRQTSWFRVACFPQPGSGQVELMGGLERG
jgi:hypothetical protein